MASVSANYNRILANVVKRFSRLKKPKNVADLIDAAVQMNATSPDGGVTSKQLQAEGVKPYAIALAVRLAILARTKVSKFRFLIVERGPRPKTPMETNRALQKERSGLYDHLLHDTNATAIAAGILSLPQGSSVMSVRRAMESGTIQHQIDLYDRVFEALKDQGLYDEEYDYLQMCFRRKAARHWLSILGNNLSK
jgi:hypothetical protein